MSGQHARGAGCGDTDQEHLRADWASRQREFGNRPQAVLLRNLPAEINAGIDQWHRDLLRWALAPLLDTPTAWVVDLGCGYGRLAREATGMGFRNVIGLDFDAGFCRQYQADFGLAVRGSVDAPPFSNNALAAAYCVTSLMYVGTYGARRGLLRLDPSLQCGARVLLVEAGAEFNSLARSILRRKRTQTLSVRGFSSAEFHAIIPGNWKMLANGSNAAMTLLLPLLLCVRRWTFAFTWISRLARRLDRPSAALADRGWRRAGLHRWVLCEKLQDAPPDCQDTPQAASTAARCNQGTPSTRA